MDVCKLVNLRKTYLSDEEVTPIKDVSLTINSGDLICIEGPSGVGKSTLLYLIGGLLKSTSGDVYIDNNNITTMTDKDLTNLRRDKIGFLFQDTYLIQALTIEENLTFIQSVCKNINDYSKIKEILHRLGLWEKRNFFPSELSGGQRRRAMIACTIIKEPLLILADEPTNDLDDYWAEEILSILHEQVNIGKAVVLVTHNEQWANKAQKRFFLDKGLLFQKNI